MLEAYQIHFSGDKIKAGFRMASLWSFCPYRILSQTRPKDGSRVCRVLKILQLHSKFWDPRHTSIPEIFWEYDKFLSSRFFGTSNGCFMTEHAVMQKIWEKYEEKVQRGWLSRRNIVVGPISSLHKMIRWGARHHNLGQCRGHAEKILWILFKAVSCLIGEREPHIF